ncbi:MAG: cytochrome c [Candidatus Hydrogenedentota bacterium]
MKTVPFTIFFSLPGIVLGILVLSCMVIPAKIYSAELVDPLNMGLTPDPDKGYNILMNTPMAAPIMKEKDLERLWKVWDAPSKLIAADATPDQRRDMIFDRYGWAKRLDDSTGLPLGYLPDGKGNLVTNCFSCHGGEVGGVTIPGAGNAHIDLTTLATDIRKLTALDQGKDPDKVPDAMAPFKTPLSIHRGTTNAVVFAAVFAGLRDAKRGKLYTQHPEELLHHDMNPPAWWNFKKKDMIYADAFAPKTPRQLMPFAFSPFHSLEKFYSFEENFVHIREYIDKLEPPKYPYEIDAALAKKGEIAFNLVCSECHGTYGENPTFPNKVIKIKKIGTDSRRLKSIYLKDREATNVGWLQYYGKHPVLLESKGYLAQPLDGIWASAPYFHNGSVPTLYHVFNIDERPDVWKRSDNGYDNEKIGLEVESFDAVPTTNTDRERRLYYDTSVVGSSNQGHPFPDDELEDDEKISVLEYLKTL